MVGGEGLDIISHCIKLDLIINVSKALIIPFISKVLR